ncbi:cytochrome b-c1 complex subunit 10-like [Dendropsophus ebraccatus]
MATFVPLLSPVQNWTPTLFTWGLVGAVGLVWATDWRIFLDCVPYINSKS